MLRRLTTWHAKRPMFFISMKTLTVIFPWSGKPLDVFIVSHCSLPFRRNFRLADLVTIMNGVCGSFSIFSSARYLLTNDIDYLWTAMAFPLAGLMFDFLDGKVARWRKSSSMLGQELDSLADLVCIPLLISLSKNALIVLIRFHLELLPLCWPL